MNDLLIRFTSRKFLLALATGLLIVLNEGFDLGIDQNAYWAIVGLAVSFIAAEGAADVVRNLPK